MLGPANQRKTIWVEHRFDGKIDIEIGPIQMMRRLKLNVEKLTYRRIPKPGKIVESQEDFVLLDQKPEAIFRDIRYLNC